MQQGVATEFEIEALPQCSTSFALDPWEHFLDEDSVSEECD